MCESPTCCSHKNAAGLANLGCSLTIRILQMWIWRIRLCYTHICAFFGSLAKSGLQSLM
ncbi:hypothetical protein NEIPOLOT_02202 [Neisseria polysaccharea ATCC 43768]|nr:hypothetical protein NEIPOLOT_02202 [Neisseria polysaccharea ATCC 43768]